MQIDIIGVPLDFGAGKRGVDMGPAALRYAGLTEQLRQEGHNVTDVGDISVPLREHAEIGDPTQRYLEPILQVQRALANAVLASSRAGRFPLVIGGDHSVALGSVTAMSRDRRVGVIWIDTHADFNTGGPDGTTPSGNVHGMPLAALCGYGVERLRTLDGWTDGTPAVDPRNVVVVGARDLDPGERQLLHRSGVTVFSMAVLDRYGARLVMEKAIDIAGRGTDGIHASFDLDVLDPAHAPGVGTPSPGGLTVREAHLAMEILALSGRVVALDVVEVNPILDERNRTGRLAVELTLSALGKRVWPWEEVEGLERL